MLIASIMCPSVSATVLHTDRTDDRYDDNGDHDHGDGDGDDDDGGDDGHVDGGDGSMVKQTKDTPPIFVRSFRNK